MSASADSPKTAFVVFGRNPMEDARRRGWGEAGRTLFQTPSPPTPLEAGLRVYHFTPGAPSADAGEVGIHRRPQRGRDFAERIGNCLDDLAREGNDRVILVGTDCPALEDADILAAHNALSRGGSALGPDDKGGVYLIGLQLADRHRLRGITWCRNDDYTQLRHRLAHRPLRHLVRRTDLDDTRDLRRIAAFSPDSALLRTVRRLLERLSRSNLPSKHGESPPQCARYWIRRMLNYRDAPPAAAA